MKRTLFFLCATLLAFASCADRNSPEHVAECFLSAYLNCRFSEAVAWASPHMQEQMRWRASQLTQAEVGMMDGRATSVEAVDVEEFDDSCVVALLVSDALLLDSIGQPGRIGEAVYHLTLKKEKGSNWKVTALACEF